MQRNINVLMPYIIIGCVFFFIFNRIVDVFQSITGTIIDKITQFVDFFVITITESPFSLGFSKEALIAGFVGAFCVSIIMLYQNTQKRRFRPGKELGDAVFGAPWESRPLRNSKEPDLNLILSKTEKINIERAKNPIYGRNKNVFCVGAPGFGKTELILENLMQLGCSKVVTETKGRILPRTGNMFLKNGFVLKFFDITDFSKSMHFNPLHYIRCETDILRNVDTLIENTTGNFRPTETFWIDAEKLLYCTIIAYMHAELPARERNIPTLNKIFRMIVGKPGEKKEEDIGSSFDRLFEDLAERKPDCFAVRQYEMFKIAYDNDKLVSSILISCAVRLAPFSIPELEEIMSYDELELDLLGDRLTAFYVMLSDTNTTYNFVLSLLFSQMFQVLFNRADTVHDGEMPVHVQIFFDEKKRIGKITNIQSAAATIRSRNGSVLFFYQEEGMAYETYGEKGANELIGCCDTYLFLGGTSLETNKNIAERIGRTTISTRSISKNDRGGGGVQEGVVGWYLIDPAQVGRIPRDECLVMVSNLNPFKSKKVNPKKHKRYKQITDGGAPVFNALAYLAESRLMSNIPTKGGGDV